MGKLFREGLNEETNYFSVCMYAKALAYTCSVPTNHINLWRRNFLIVRHMEKKIRSSCSVYFRLNN